jgi:hypothetical protein
MLTRLLAFAHRNTVLLLALCAVALGTCATSGAKEDTIVLLAFWPPIDAQIHVHVETATLSLG